MNSFGTDEVIEEIVKKYSPSMLRAAFSVLRNTHDAEDAVQEAFMKLIRKNPSFHDETHEKAWLLRVTINNAKNIRRFHARESIQLEENRTFVYDENTDVLNDVLSLPEKYRVVIHLYYYEGYSIKEIAEILKQTGVEPDTPESGYFPHLVMLSALPYVSIAAASSYTMHEKYSFSGSSKF